MSEDQLRNIDALLIYNNKTDLPNSLNTRRVAEILELNSIKQKWFIQPCSALKNEGIHDGLLWLSKQI